MGSSRVDKKFDQYICLEMDPVRKAALEKRAEIAAKTFDTCKPIILNQDCNLAIEQVLDEYCPRKACFLAFVDPQRVSDLKWVTLQKLLSHCKGDLILNFPTSGIVRNLNIPESHDTLSSFFGDENWDDVQKDTDSILSYYIQKIQSIYVGAKSRTVDYLPVLDEQNHRLYDLIFATGSAGMKNALDDLKERLEKVKTRDFRQLHDVVAGPQRQLFDH